METMRENCYKYLHDAFMDAPFSKYMNTVGVDLKKGEAVVKLKVEQEKHKNTNNVVHGAVSAFLLDTSGGLCIRTMLDESKSIATINISINYLKPAHDGILYGKGKVKSIGKRVATIESEVVDENGSLIATSIATFTIINLKNSTGKD